MKISDERRRNIGQVESQLSMAAAIHHLKFLFYLSQIHERFYLFSPTSPFPKLQKRLAADRLETSSNCNPEVCAGRNVPVRWSAEARHLQTTDSCPTQRGERSRREREREEVKGCAAQPHRSLSIAIDRREEATGRRKRQARLSGRKGGNQHFAAR